jgi:O-antigen/teichoic acid export membrane protein
MPDPVPAPSPAAERPPVRRIPAYWLVSASAWVGRAVTAGAQLAVIALLLNRVGAERYAAFALSQGLMAWFLLLELGLGPALQNHISECRATGRSYLPGIAAAAAVLGVLVAAAGALLWGLSEVAGPVLYRRFDFLSDAEKAHLLLVTGGLFTAVTLGTIGYRIWFAEQRGVWANLVPAVGSLLGLGAVHARLAGGAAPGPAACMVAFYGPVAGVAVGSLLWHMVRRRPRLGDLEFSVFAALLRRAGRFFVFSLLATLTLGIDYLIASQTLTPAQLGAYAITQKCFATVYMLYAGVLSALWPVYTEAIVRHDWRRVLVLLERPILVATAGMVLFTFALAAASVWGAPVLAARGLQVTLHLVLLFGLYQTLMIWIASFSTVLQSMNDFSYLKWVPLQIAVGFAGQYALALRFGPSGIVAGLILSALAVGAWITPRQVLRAVRRAPDGAAAGALAGSLLGRAVLRLRGVRRLRGAEG